MNTAHPNYGPNISVPGPVTFSWASNNLNKCFNAFFQLSISLKKFMVITDNLSGESNPLRNFEALISPEEPYTPIGHENLTKSVYKSTRAVTTKNKYGKYGFDL